MKTMTLNYMYVGTFFTNSSSFSVSLRLSVECLVSRVLYEHFPMLTSVKAKAQSGLITSSVLVQKMNYQTVFTMHLEPTTVVTTRMLEFLAQVSTVVIFHGISYIL